MKTNMKPNAATLAEYRISLMEAIAEINPAYRTTEITTHEDSNFIYSSFDMKPYGECILDGAHIAKLINACPIPRVVFFAIESDYNSVDVFLRIEVADHK